MLAYTGQNIVGSVKPGFVGGAPQVGGYNPTVGSTLAAVGQDDIARQVERQIALREAGLIEKDLKRPFPAAGTIRLERHVPSAAPKTPFKSMFAGAPQQTGGPGTLGTYNHKHSFGPGPHSRLCIGGDWLCTLWSMLFVPKGTKLVAFRGKGFSGAQKTFGPGYYNLHSMGWADANAPKSGIVMPNIDLDGMVDKAVTMIGGLASPAKGCLITQQNFKTFGVVQALYGFIDRLVATYYKGTPYEGVYQTKRRDLENKLLNDILANQGVCGAATAAKDGKIAIAAPAVCPKGTYKATNAAVARAYRRAGYVEMPPSCYGRPCPRGAFRAASQEEETAYSNAGMQQAIPGCWGRPGATIPKKKKKKKKAAPRRPYKAKSFRGSFIRSRPVGPASRRLRVGYVAGYVAPPTVEGYYEGTVGGCGCGHDVEYDD